MLSMEGVIMAVLRPNFPGAPSSATTSHRTDPDMTRSPSRPRPLDPAHEHGTASPPRDLARNCAWNEHCPSEVYVG